MGSNYEQIIKDNLEIFYSDLKEDIAGRMGATQAGDVFELNAFGGICRISPEGVVLDGAAQTGPVGILITLYALHASQAPMQLEPLKSFKDFSNTMPYVGAFTIRTEQALVPHVENIETKQDLIKEKLMGADAPAGVSGDFVFVVKPLPKVSLCYIFYKADEDFPASATCLYSNNTDEFMPPDGMADVGEYTSKKIIEIIGGAS